MRTFATGFALVMAVVAATVLPAGAQEGRVGLGFTTTEAPVGGRYWLADSWGLDFGLGITTHNDLDRTDYALSVGVPIVVREAGIGETHSARFNVRPGFLYRSIDRGSDSDKIFGLGLQLEFEVFMVKDFSVRAAHGVGLTIADPAGAGETTTDFTTQGDNLTTVGFYYYFD